MMTNISLRRASQALVAICAGIAIGLLVLAALSRDRVGKMPAELAAEVNIRPPADLHSLVAGRDGLPHTVIVDAIVSSVVATATLAFPTYDPGTHGTLAPGEENALQSLKQLWESVPDQYETILQLSPLQTLLDDGTHPPGAPIEIRSGAIDTETTGPGSYPPERVGERYLYFLNSWRDCDTCPYRYAVVWGPYGRLKVSGSEVTYSDDTPVEFARGTPPLEFVQAVATEVARQHGTPTP